MIYEDLSVGFVKLIGETRGRAITFDRQDIDQLLACVAEDSKNSLVYSLNSDPAVTKHTLDTTSAEVAGILNPEGPVITDASYFPLELVLNPQTGKPLGAERPIVRSSKRTKGTIEYNTVSSQEINILLISSRAARDLDFDDEPLFRAILGSCHGQSTRIVVTRLKDCVFEELNDLLTSHTYHIIHFNVHGDYLDMQTLEDGIKSCKFGSATRNAGYFLFFRGNDCIRLVSPVEITDLFDTCSHKPALIIFSSCNSAAYHQVIHASFAEHIFLKTDVSVIGMQYLASLELAHRFFRSFYKAILEGSTLIDCLLIGRKSLVDSSEGLPDWWIPVLYTDNTFVLESRLTGIVEVDSDTFVGRAKEISELEHLVKHSINVLLYGDPGVGKTSIAKYLQNYLRLQGNYVLYFDLKGLSEKPSETQLRTTATNLIIIDHVDEHEEYSKVTFTNKVQKLQSNYPNATLLFIARSQNVVKEFQEDFSVDYYHLRGLARSDIQAFIKECGNNLTDCIAEIELFYSVYHGNPKRIKEALLGAEPTLKGALGIKQDAFYLRLSAGEKKSLLAILQFENSIPDGHIWLFCKIAEMHSVIVNEIDFHNILKELKQLHFVPDYAADEIEVSGTTLVDTKRLRACFEQYFSNFEIAKAREIHTDFYRSLAKFYYDSFSSMSKQLGHSRSISNNICEYELGNCLQSAIRSIRSYESFVYQAMLVIVHFETEHRFGDIVEFLYPVVDQCKKSLSQAKHVPNKNFIREFFCIADGYFKALTKVGTSSTRLDAEIRSYIEIVELFEMPSNDLAFFVSKYLEAIWNDRDRLKFIEKYLLQLNFLEKFGYPILLEYIDILMRSGKYLKVRELIHEFQHRGNKELDASLSARATALELVLDERVMAEFLARESASEDNKFRKDSIDVLRLSYTYLLRIDPARAGDLAQRSPDFIGYDYFIQKCFLSIASGAYLEAESHAIIAVRAAARDQQRRHQACMMLGHVLFLREQYETALGWYLQAEALIDSYGKHAHIDHMMGCKKMIVLLLVYFDRPREAEEKLVELVKLAVKKADAQILAMIVAPPLNFLSAISHDSEGFKLRISKAMGCDVKLLGTILDEAEDRQAFNTFVVQVGKTFLTKILLRISEEDI